MPKFLQSRREKVRFKSKEACIVGMAYRIEKRGRLTGVPYESTSFMARRELETTPKKAHAERLRAILEAHGITDECGIVKGPRGDTLHRMIRAGDVLQTRGLCIAGTDLEWANSAGETAVVVAVGSSIAALRVLLEFDPVMDGTLLRAAEVGDPEIFRLVVGYLSEHGMLAREAERRNNGYNCLHLAAVSNAVPLLKIAAEFDELARVKEARTAGRDQQTPAQKATRYGHYAALKVLLRDMGASVDAWDNHGQQAIHIAAALGYYQCLDLLVRFGAKPNSRDKHGHGRRPVDHCKLGLASKTLASKVRYSKKLKPTTISSTDEAANYSLCVSLLDNPPAPDRLAPDDFVPDDHPPFFLFSFCAAKSDVATSDAWNDTLCALCAFDGRALDAPASKPADKPHRRRHSDRAASASSSKPPKKAPRTRRAYTK